MRKLCDFFACSTDDLYVVLSDNPILRQLQEEKNHKISGGIYHELQIRMSYNSIHIEGSNLKRRAKQAHI